MIFLLNNNVRDSSNKINIFSVKNSKDLKTFYKLPFQLYKNNPYWIPTFWKEFKDFFNKKNPFWTHSDYKLFIAWKNSKIVGRIAAIIDYKYCETVGKKIGYFGFFESIDDFECAEAVFNSAQNWLKSKNMTIMRGPIDGRVDINLGFLLTGFDKPASILSSYTPEYYISFAERFNMKKIRDFISYYIDLTKPFPDILKENVQKSIDFGIKIRPFKRFSANLELKWWTQLFLETFKDQWGFVPVSKKEVKSRFGVKQIRWFVDSKLFLVAEYKGSPIAYLWSTPEYNQLFKNFKGRLSLYQLLQILISKKQINIGKLHFIGIKKEFRNKNIASYLNYEALVEMKRRGYIGAEVGFIDERNTVAHSTIAKTGAKRYKKFRVFEKIINT
jgi:ribosomal protein S18 acetylase RimI-like enzyme